MASYNSLTKRSFLVSAFISLTFFVLLPNKVKSLEPYTFRFVDFEPEEEGLNLQGDATVLTSNWRLQLTKVENGEPVKNSVGRALYSEPIQIWDRTTGEVGSFATSFSFVINAHNKSNVGDGIAFFLAAADNGPQSPGGLLGLFKDESYNKSNQILAFEFDTFSNEWDPKGSHFGINVNSIKSRETFSCDWESGDEITVMLLYSYGYYSKGLNAFVLCPSRGRGEVFDAYVDVKEVLPEYVRVGLTSATGDFVQTTQVLHWSFTNNFEFAGTNNLFPKERFAHLLRSKLHNSF